MGDFKSQSPDNEFHSWDPMAEDYNSPYFNSIYQEDFLDSILNPSSVRNVSRSSVVSLYVTNFPDSMTEDDLKRLFSNYGKVARIHLKKQPNKPPFAFVDYNSSNEAQEAIMAWNKKPPHFMIVEVAYPKNENKIKQGAGFPSNMVVKDKSHGASAEDYCSSQGSLPVSKRNTLSNRFENPSSCRFGDLTSNGFENRASGRYEKQATGRNHHQGPDRYEHPISDRYEKPKTGRYENTLLDEYHPIPDRYDYPAPGRHEQPAPGRYEQPAPGRYEQPAPGRYEQPAPGRYEQPTPGRYEQPAPGRYEQPAPDRYEQPAPGRYEQPAPGRYEHPAPGRYEHPAPGRYEQPTPGRYEQPAPGRYEHPAPGRYEQPAPGRYEQPAPGRNEQPAPDRNEQPAPDKYKHAVPVDDDFKNEQRMKTTFSSKDSSSSDNTETSQNTRGNIFGDSFKNLKVVLSASGERCVYESHEETKSDEKNYIPICQRPHFRSHDVENSSTNYGVLQFGGERSSNAIQSDVSDISGDVKNIKLQIFQDERHLKNEIKENNEGKKEVSKHHMIDRNEVMLHYCAICTSDASFFCSHCRGWFCSADCLKEHEHDCTNKQHKENSLKGKQPVFASEKNESVSFQKNFEKLHLQEIRSSEAHTFKHDGRDKVGNRNFQDKKFADNSISSLPSLNSENADVLNLSPAKKLSTDITKEVIITEICDSNSFWVRLVEEEARFLCISQKLRSIKLNERRNLLPKIGNLCTVKMFTNQNFCRCQITEVKQKTNVNVICIDTGSSKEVHSSEIFTIDKSLMAVPPLAIKCRLDIEADFKFKSEANNLLQKYIRKNSKLWAKQIGTVDDVFIVKLFTNNDKDDIGGLLVEAGYASKERHSDASDSHIISALSKIKEAANFVLIERNSSELLGIISSENLMPDAQLIMETFPADFHERKSFIENFSASPGMLVAALSTEEGSWYRAVVLENNTKISVCLIDYPSTEEGNLIQPLPETYRSSPTFAVRCNICSHFNEDTIASFESMKSIPIQITKKQKDAVFGTIVNSNGSSFEVCLTPWFTEEKFLNKSKIRTNSMTADLKEILCSQNRILLKDIPKEPVPLNDLIAVSPSWIETFENIYVTQKSNESLLHRLADEIQKYCNNAELIDYHPKVGEIVCAKFNDGSWYRAYVTQIDTDKKISVYYIDYGNFSVVALKDVLRLPTNLISYPQFAKRVSWNVKKPAILLQDFAELLSKEEIFIKVLKEGEPLIVDFYNNQQCIMDESGCFKKLSRSVNSQIGEISKMCLLYMNDLTSLFFTRISPESIADLEEMTNKISCLKPKILSDPKENMKCLGLFKEDNSWYRGVILKIDNGSATVSFIDYGNCEVIPFDCLAEIPSDFEIYPTFAIHCRVHGCENKLSKEQMNILRNLLVLNEVYDVHLLNLDDRGIYSIEIPSITRDLQSHGMLQNEKNVAASHKQEGRTKKPAVQMKKYKYTQAKGRKN